MRTHTVPVLLVVLLVGALFAVGAAAATDEVQFEPTDDGQFTPADAEIQQQGNITFTSQATASSTATLGGVSSPGVVVGPVDADVDSAVVVTYPNDGNLTIAGLDTFNASELGGGTVAIPVNDTSGFPGNHTAHLIPIANLSQEYSAGDNVSDETAQGILDNEQATVYQGVIEFADQSFDTPAQEGDVMAQVSTAALLDGGANDTAFTVDVHPVDDQGNLIGPEYVGSTDVLAGQNTDVNITAERVPQNGTWNELPLSGTDAYVAMIHVVDDGAAPGDPASPGQYPVLPHGSASGPVPAGVTDAAVLEFPLVQNLTFNDQDLGADGNVTVEGVQSDGVESAVIITYPNDGNLTIAGLTTGIFDNESVAVPIQDAGGFPGEHTAHIVPVANLSGAYAPGDNVSAATAGEIRAQDTANVTEAVPAQSLTFNDQNVDQMTVTAENVQSDGVESAVIITYAENESLVVAGLTTGTFDNESVQVAIEDNGGLPGNHTAHIVPVSGLSGQYAPGDTVSAETAGNILDQGTGAVGIDLDGNGNSAADTTGDGLLNDVNGDGSFDIFDVQVLFDHLDTVNVQENPDLFAFAGTGLDRVSIFDVQGLYTQLQNAPT